MRLILINNALVRLKCEVTTEQMERLAQWIETGYHGVYDDYLLDAEVNPEGYNTFAYTLYGIVEVEKFDEDPRMTDEQETNCEWLVVEMGKDGGKVIVFALKGEKEDSYTHLGLYSSPTDVFLDLESDDSLLDSSWVDNATPGALCVLAPAPDSAKVSAIFDEIAQRLRKQKVKALPVTVVVTGIDKQILPGLDDMLMLSKYKSVTRVIV